MATTTNLGITLPTVGADDDTWGTVNNNAIIAFDALYVAAGSGTSVGLKVGSGKTLNALDGTVILGDAGLTLKDTSDSTKIAAFQCSGITAGQTRTYTLPDASGTLLYSGGALGTPASGTLTSCTGLPISTGVSGLGTGVATLLAGTPSGTGGPAGAANPIFSGDPSIGNSTTGGRLILNGPASTSNNSYINFSYGGTAKAYIGLNSGLLGNASNDLLVYSVADSVKVYAAAGLVGTFTSTGINSTAIGATTPGTGAFTTLSSSSTTALKGTTTNDSAAAGYIGEYISSSAANSAVSMTAGSNFDMTSISLTAGDWDVEGNVAIAVGAGATVSVFRGWISTTSATFPTPPNAGAMFDLVFGSAVMATPTQAMPVGRIRISLSGTTTVYLSSRASFSGGTVTGGGFIGARRVR